MAADELPTPGECRSQTGSVLPSDGILRVTMREAVNPSLSSISLRLFHDARPFDDEARQGELASASDDLARCLMTLPRRFAGDESRRADFQMQAFLAAHSAQALASAARQHDRNAELHWFMHLKESCESCHEEHRFHRFDAERAP